MPFGEYQFQQVVVALGGRVDMSGRLAGPDRSRSAPAWPSSSKLLTLPVCRASSRAVRPAASSRLTSGAGAQQARENVIVTPQGGFVQGRAPEGVRAIHRRAADQQALHFPQVAVMGGPRESWRRQRQSRRCPSFPAGPGSHCETSGQAIGALNRLHSSPRSSTSDDAAALQLAEDVVGDFPLYCARAGSWSPGPDPPALRCSRRASE